MAGQLTFTKGPVRQGERASIMRAMMSLPVPLSPWISTGTLALATLSIRSRRDCMVSEWPKITVSGGISPNEVIRELTELMVVIACGRQLLQHTMTGCTPRAKPTACLAEATISAVPVTFWQLKGLTLKHLLAQTENARHLSPGPPG